MPKAWSAKDERQYEHIKDSEREMGRGTKRAKAIAAATVNKRRTDEGRTKDAAPAGGQTTRRVTSRTKTTRAKTTRAKRSGSAKRAAKKR
jgi:hypothetical protein